MSRAPHSSALLGAAWIARVQAFRPDLRSSLKWDIATIALISAIRMYTFMRLPAAPDVPGVWLAPAIGAMD
jgi:hypothetical protein